MIENLIFLFSLIRTNSTMFDADLFTWITRFFFTWKYIKIKFSNSESKILEYTVANSIIHEDL